MAEETEKLIDMFYTLLSYYYSRLTSKVISLICNTL